MSYDPTLGRIVLFGGEAGPFFEYQDTWGWDGNLWAPLGSGPSARYGHRMCYDSQRQALLLTGGRNLAGVVFSDTWMWGSSGWIRLASLPVEMHGHAMSYDSRRARPIVFGSGGTFELSVASGAATFGQGCGAPPLTLSPEPTAPPRIGAVARARIDNVPGTFAFVSWGWSVSRFGPFSLPLTLATYGMPGCDLLQSADTAALPTAPITSSSAEFSLAIPNASILLGLTAYLQAWAFAPAANVGHTIVSNGLQWGIGDS